MTLTFRILLILDVIAVILGLMALLTNSGKVNRFWRYFISLTVAYTTFLAAVFFSNRQDIF